MTSAPLPSQAITLTSVNIGKAAALPASGRLSGIDKKPQTGPVAVDRHGLVGDRIVDESVHGGPDQALYAYTAEDYAHFEGLLERWLAPGTFGENLTLAGLSSAGVAVGDRFSNGRLVIEVTSPRAPCATFADHMGDAQIVKRFFAEGRPGFYLRVVTPGTVAAGERFAFTPHQGDRITMAEMLALYQTRAIDAAMKARLLAAPINRFWREQILAG